MRFVALTTWLLSTACLVSASAEAEEPYVPLPLNETVADLGLEELIKEIPTDLVKRGVDRCVAACAVLSLALGSAVQTPNESIFNTSKASYWAQQQSLVTPACFIAVQNHVSVAIVITIARVTQCKFAVRGGGHSDIPGASNIQGGITIDLRALRSINVSQDRKVVSVGAGAKWGEVYTALDASGLKVIGGRASSVGVGGLLLGGGVSFFSAGNGFACDNVRNYVVMMADGIILNVNQQSHPDLYWALRGGGNNFGIVLRFDLEASEHGQMWGGLRVYPIQAQQVITSGLATFNANAGDDPNASVITSFMYMGGMYLSTVIFDYALPVANPAIIEQHFGGLSNFPKIMDTTRITSLTDLAIEVGGSTPAGGRNQYTTATYMNSAALQDRMITIFQEELEAVIGQVSDPNTLKPVIAFQPISTSITSQFAKNGGNPLGISASEGPLLLVQFNWGWKNIQDDTVVLAAIDRILNRSNAVAAQMGLSNDYIYQNYAAPNQKPFAGYGAANVARLRSVQSKYDSCKVFEALQPGGFKLHD